MAELLFAVALTFLPIIAAGNAIYEGLKSPWGFAPLANAVIALASLAVSSFGFLWLAVSCKGDANLTCQVQSSWVGALLTSLTSTAMVVLASSAALLFVFGLFAPLIPPLQKK